MNVEILAIDAAHWEAYQGQSNQPEGWGEYKPFMVQCTPGEHGWRRKNEALKIYAKNRFHARMYCHYHTEYSQIPSSKNTGAQAEFTLVEE